MTADDVCDDVMAMLPEDARDEDFADPADTGIACDGQLSLQGVQGTVPADGVAGTHDPASHLLHDQLHAADAADAAPRTRRIPRHDLRARRL